MESIEELKRISKGQIFGAPAAAKQLLLREELADIGEGLEFKRIAGRIEEEHGLLLANLTP